MKNLRLEKDEIIEENLIKDVRKFFRLKKEINGNIIKDIRNLFGLKKGNKASKDRIIKDTGNLFKHEEE